MRSVSFYREARGGKAHDAAYPGLDDDLAEAVAEAVVDSIATDVKVTLGGVTIFLAMLLDPAHWEEDWNERGVGDVDAFLAGLVEDAP